MRRSCRTYDCGVTQGDVQVFHQADEPGRTFVGYASDTFGDGTSTCYREAQALGFDVLKERRHRQERHVHRRRHRPAAPEDRLFVEVDAGLAQPDVHPSGNYLYNSNSDLITSIQPAIEVFDISDPAAPSRSASSAAARPGLGTESHDITLLRRRHARLLGGALAGRDHRHERPRQPAIISSFLDPTINVWHQMDPFTITDASGREREFVIAEDEFAGAVGTGQCPNGGVHVFEIDRRRWRRRPEKVGYWNIDDARPDRPGRRHLHRPRLRHPRGREVMTIAYYNGGVHVVDLAGLDRHLARRPAGRRRGHEGDRLYRIQDVDTWSAKTPRDRPHDGVVPPVRNDIARGLDVYSSTARPPTSAKKGTWMGAAQAAKYFAGLPKVSVTKRNALVCLLPQQ